MGGHIITNTQAVDPMPVITGAAEYPTDILDTLSEKGASVDSIDAYSLAVSAGSGKAVNIVLMGRLSRYFDIPVETWLSAVEETVKPKFAEINKKAFMLGREN